MSHPATPYPRLLADVGGTNIRLALQDGDNKIGPVTTLNVADFESLELAIRCYLENMRECGVLHAAIGLPNPVLGDHVKLTNYNWAFSIEQMRRNLGWQTLLVLNDFTALALALPHLPEDALIQVRPGTPYPHAPRAVVGPGTGLGISALMPDSHGHAFALAGEGGHMEITPATSDEWVAWHAAQRKYGRVSAERLLCGKGISHIHAALSEASGYCLHEHCPPQAIIQNALSGADPICQRTFEVFCGLLGSTAASTALLLGARGGVYIGGGIVPRFVNALLTSSFQSRFEAAGRLREYLSNIPVFIITATHAALYGLLHALEDVVTYSSSPMNGVVALHNTCVQQYAN